MKGINDEPLKYLSLDEDTLGTNKYANTLSNFIELTNTPMSIGIQGEWGAGKTSLLKAIWQNLEKSPTNLMIWINAWEHSLLTLPEEALIKIIIDIANEIQTKDTNRANSEKILRTTKILLKKAFTIGTNISLNSIGVNVDSSDILESLLDKKESSVSGLRNSLQEAIQNICSNPDTTYKRVVIFVDDLDRLDPIYAVQVLELIKNIFGIKYCIFLLAIDYQVVVKGLKHKFGEMNNTNEWEFRAFFDKLIQLPFVMPLGEYTIGHYIKTLLIKINYISDLDTIIMDYEKITLYSIGNNPRAIKRLVNSLLLIEMMNNNLIEDKHDKFLMFAMVCIQIAYPNLYQALLVLPDFTLLDDELTFSFTKGQEVADPLFETSYQRACGHHLFSNDWERSLYRLAYLTPHTRSRIFDISRFFNLILDYIYNNNLEVSSTLSPLIHRSSITNIKSSEEAEQQTGIEKKRTRLEGLDTYLVTQKERGLPIEITNLLEDIHNKVLFILKEEKIYVNYTPTVMSFNANIPRKKKCFLYIIPHKKRIELHCDGDKFFLSSMDTVEKDLLDKIKLDFLKVIR